MQNGTRVIGLLIALLLFWVPAVGTADHGIPWGYCRYDTPVIMREPHGAYTATLPVTRAEAAMILANLRR